MHRSSPARRPLALLFGLTLLAPPAPAFAQDKDNSTPVKFDTRDGVSLHGTFYPGESAKVKDEPVVLLLHRVGSHSHQDGWDSLAKALQKKGYSVLSFDFRGHGKSTAVDGRTFWGQPHNQRLVRGFNPAKPKDAISSKDFTPAYTPYLVNDIAAAKLFLDERNDAGECNSRSVIVIGAEEGATLGCLWMAAEWHRHPATVIEGFRSIITKVDEAESEGKDQYAGIWLSIEPNLKASGAAAGLRNWLTLVGKEKKVPMAFIHGKDDDRGGKLAAEYVRHLKGNEKDSLKFTNVRAIEKTKLAGSALLRKELGTDAWIVDTYLAALREKNTPAKWTRRDPYQTAFAWTFQGRPYIAKSEKGKSLEPVPLERMGLLP